MSYDLVLEHAQIMTYSDHGVIQETVNIGVRNGIIETLSTAPISGKTSANMKGLLVLPGIIDSQVHFREPGMTHKEDLESGTRGAALGGVTSIFEMPNTVPATTTHDLFQDKLKRAAGRAWVNYGFFIGGSPENVAQLAELELQAGCAGIKVFMGSSTGTLLVEDDETLEKIFRSGRRRVILHSEDERRLRERKHIAIESKDVHQHHIWRDVETAFQSTTRLLKLAEKTGRPVHVLHVTSAEEMTILARAKHIASVEVLPQHLTLFAPDCYDRLGNYAQQNPPIREKRHLEALWKALNDGIVDVIGSDHAPHTREEKDREYPTSPSGMPSVQTMVPIMLNHVAQGRLPLQKLVQLVCENPRWVFGCKKKGRIAVGMDADFTVVDLKKERLIENSWIVSKSGWTPYDGMKTVGWPIHTIVGGEFVVRDSLLVGKQNGKPVTFFS